MESLFTIIWLLYNRQSLVSEPPRLVRFLMEVAVLDMVLLVCEDVHELNCCIKV